MELGRGWMVLVMLLGCPEPAQPGPDPGEGLEDCDGWCIDLGCPTDGARCEMGTCVCFGCAEFEDYISGEGVLGAACE